MATATAAGGPFDGDARRSLLLPLAAVGAAGLMSVALVGWVTGSSALAAGFVGVALIAVAAIVAVQRLVAPATGQATDTAASDWSLVRSVAQAAGQAMAITDRSGRLVCANDLYCGWFDGAVTPPGLPVDSQTAALLADAGRSAWRDGEAAVSSFAAGTRTLSGVIERIGRADDHLLWRFAMIERPDPLAQAVAQVRGEVGRALGAAGVMAAVVSATGTVRACNEALRLRATGSLATELEGQEFVNTLRIDGSGLIRFARERDGATPLRIIEIPFDRDDDRSPIFLLLIDEDGGAGERGVALDYVQRLLMALPFGLAMVDRDGRFLFSNPQFARAVGTKHEAMPAWPVDLILPDDRRALSDAIRRQAAGRSTEGSIGVRFAARAAEPVTLGLVGVRGMGDAAVLMTIGHGADPAQPELSQSMLQATKMQAVGQLAGGIAHDFNNVLTGILGSCDLMLLRHSPGDSDYDDLQQIRSNTNRAANLTRQLLAFSRQQTLRPQILNLSDIVADVSHLLERLIGERIVLDVQHGRGLGPVRADPGQLEQVIVNLAVNAKDAMPEGGKVTITTRAVPAAEVEAIGEGVMPPGDYAMLSVTDTGQGIPSDVMPKIFDPFFTTKDVGKGTGLGLATVYGIVKQSGGFVFATSEPGKGTEFSIYLPVYAGSEVAEQPRAPAASARSTVWGTGHILLVEDEDMVRAVADRALSRAGYTVTTASNGEDGLERFEEMESVDMVVTDVMMPLMDGPAMVAAIRAKMPRVPVLFMSGYAEEQLRQSITLPNVAFLAKPFSVAQLVDAIAAVRDGAPITQQS